MMKSLFLCTVLSMCMTVAPTKNDISVEKWTPIGLQRITCYCPVCNDGAGHESSSGKELEYGDCACSWLPIGTKVCIEGDIFTNVDTCGTDAIDIFIDTDDEYCRCNLNEYKEVSVLYEK